MRNHKNRQRGGTALIVVLGGSLLIGTFVMGSGAVLTPTLTRLRHSHASDQALAIAEAGAALARSELAHDPTWSGCTELALNAGSLTTTLDRREDLVLVLSRGTVTSRINPGETVTRRVTVRLRLRAEALPAVIAWQEH